MSLVNFRRLIRNTIIESVSPFKNVQNNLTFFYGHHMGRSFVDSNLLYENLKKLKEKVSFLNFEEACHLASENKTISHPVACFSFDDGFRDVTKYIYPVLQELGVNCCIFVNPGFVEASNLERQVFYRDRFHIEKEPSSWDELKLFIENNGIVGSHTINHLRLSKCKTENIHSEIVDSKKIIEEKLNIDCDYFAWPYGTARDISSEQIELALQHYKLIFSAIRTPQRYFRNRRVINRDHFEGDWKYSHLKYFLSVKKNNKILAE